MIKNTCTKCNQTWKISAPKWQLKLNEIDAENLAKHNQLYSICEDCHESNECISVEKGEK